MCGRKLLVVRCRLSAGNAAAGLPALPAANRVLGRRLHTVWDLAPFQRYDSFYVLDPTPIQP